MSAEKVVNASRTILGASSAAEAVIADYLQASTGILEIELGPHSFDAMLATTGFELNGTLDVRTMPGFPAGLGQSYQILSAAPVFGIVATEPLPSLGGGLALDPAYGATYVRLNVVATPSFSADFDGDVDDIDLGIWKGALSRTAASAPISEPATSWLFIAAATGIHRMAFTRMRQELVAA